ncbi:cytochrome bd-I ubiquinol oxidase subunit 1 [mine drainage metagenome]|uniref:Cytochrome bd-I ubiquinol oxidase subunit 1 n=1 Tax=mine drainage metagenome TaxID=410659 RepID=A0A1J5Q0N1_9ZZZZ
MKVLTQNTALATFGHTIPAAFFTGGAFIAGVSAWLIVKNRDVEMAKPAAKLGLVTMIVSFLLVFVSGDISSRVMTNQQPMKMAAAEALYTTQSGAPFSLFTVGTLDGSRPVFSIDLPSMLSLLSTGNTKGVVQGVNDLEAKYKVQYGPGNYTPNIPLAYWSFRLMIGFGGLGLLFALLALWRMRKGGLPKGRWFLPAMISLPFLPLLANSLGWIFTETGRQPWAVFGLIKTADGVSPSVAAGNVAITMIGFTILYGILAVIEFGLIIRTIKVGPAPDEPQRLETEFGGDTERPLTMAY